jgi:hypothetical protein
MSRTNVVLSYDHQVWREQTVRPVNTLQLFITNQCNLRCRGCFYEHSLGRQEMDVETYISYLDQYAPQVEKVILLGGEPLLFGKLGRLLEENSSRGLRTTIYTNGRNLDRLQGLSNMGVELRIGVYGVVDSEKPMAKVGSTDWPVKIVYMLRRDNTQELMLAAKEAEARFNCRGFYLSSIRDITVTGDYWQDTPETLTPWEFAQQVQRFVDLYDGGLPRLDLATRGVIRTAEQDFMETRHCRFGNVFPNGERIICPFDISKRVTSSELTFGSRSCNKHNRCLLQKIVLVRS